MKTIVITLCSLLLVIHAQGRPFGPKIRAGNMERAAERAAMHEELVLDHLDTHKWKKDPEATDQRPQDLVAYHNRTFQRIVHLLKHGSISEENGKLFKEKHTGITEAGKSMKASGDLTEEQKAELRSKLDGLNDEINAALQASEEGANRTPVLNKTQHRFEEKIEFGARSGRLSSSEVSRLNRMVEKLKTLEEREKAEGLSTRDREKLFEEAGELAVELNKALMD